MRVALHDNERNAYPNLALMKLSARYKEKGYDVEWFDPAKTYDVVCSSKIFTWTEKDPALPSTAVCGGTGNNVTMKLPEEVEHICPDYSLYGAEKSYGFLTRGCIRNCPWCFVPKKEGTIKAHADIDEFCRHKEVVLMDNNVLAHDHGIAQIEKMAKMGVKVDFNQGLDARLIDVSVARRLGNLKRLHPVRLDCDTAGQIDSISKAVQLLRWHNVTPRRYFCYVLVKDIGDAIERVKFLKGIHVDPFCQPYRDAEGNEPTKEQRAFARWVNMKAAFNVSTWEEYKAEKLKPTPAVKPDDIDDGRLW